jgi:hypothetical protein
VTIDYTNIDGNKETVKRKWYFGDSLTIEINNIVFNNSITVIINEVYYADKREIKKINI